MAKKKTQAQRAEAGAQTAPASRSNIFKGTLIAFLGLPLAAVLLPSMLVLLVTMLPTLGAYLADRHREKFFTATIGMMNFCGALPAIADLWVNGQTYGDALRIVSDLLVWLAAYGAAGIGWLISMMMGPVLQSYYTMASQTRMVELRNRQEQLLEAWGESIAGGPIGAPEGEPEA